MHSWPIPTVPSVAGDPVPLRLHDTADEAIRPVRPRKTATMYVCGITPYDATHLGHAATYLTFDLAYRVLLDNGHEVHYVQNITDVDDPLFERAERDGVDWRELGQSQIDLFRDDMKNLSVIPPRDYIGAIESVGEVVDMVGALLESGAAYQLDDEYPDIYFDRNATATFGYESNYDEATMAELFAERGGDPDREGKRDPLDALLWRAEREGEPAWDAPFGRGRPGWHIECSAIAVNRLGTGFDIQGGGSDLAFPHHEFSAAHAEAATGCARMAGHYVHTGMIALDGVKMSKSLGNLVFVSKLVAGGTDPSAIRLGVFSGHYRADRDWSEDVLAEANDRLSRWRRAAVAASADASGDDSRAASEAESTSRASSEAAAAVIQTVREALSDDLDTPRALAAVDGWANGVVAAAPADAPDAESADVPATEFSGAGAEIAAALDALLGVKL